jgi:hypothetical protein
MAGSLLQTVRAFLLRHSRLAAFLARVLVPVEQMIKIPIFGCRMCGQCVLHYTGMTCPMTCPKNLRNGPCGGVRLNSRCEVKPEMECVWVKAYRRSRRLLWPEEIHDLRPPVDWGLKGGSSWANYLAGRDQIVSGCNPNPASALEVVDRHG